MHMYNLFDQASAGRFGFSNLNLHGRTSITLEAVFRKIHLEKQQLEPVSEEKIMALRVLMD